MLRGLGIILGLMFAVGCQAKEAVSFPLGKGAGFLTAADVPNMVNLLPAPPAGSDSIEFMRDVSAYLQGKALRATPRGALAAADADLGDVALGKAFSEAVGVEISKEATPQTFLLLRKILFDAGKEGTLKAKDYYNRVRPFAYFNETSCTPHEDEILRRNGSYPSGHTSYGWAAALTLASMLPEKSEQILQRGYEIGQSRVVCGAHWQSDVDNGRVVGATVFALLSAKPEFVQLQAAAKRELEAKAVR